MKSVIDPVSGDTYNSTDYETLEERAQGARHASDSDASGTDGADEVLWISGSGGIADATAVTLDENHDWRGRVVDVLYVELASAAQRPGGALDYTDYGTLSHGRAMGWLGSGGWSAVAGSGTAVSNGAKPVAATGGVTSYRFAFYANVYLFADPTTGALKVYNDSGGALHFVLRCNAFGAIT